MKRKFLDLENAIRHSLKAFGIRLNKVGRAGFERAVREAVADDALTHRTDGCHADGAGGVVEAVLSAA